MPKYAVHLYSKNTPELVTIRVEANSEDEAYDALDKMINNDREYAHYKSGWRFGDVEEDCST